MIDRSLLLVAFSDPAMDALQRGGLVDSASADCEASFTGPLRAVFRELHAFDLWCRYAEVGPGAANRELLEFARHAKPDFVLWPTKMYEMLEGTLTSLRADGCDVIGMFFDDEMRFDDYSVLWTPLLSAAITADPAAVARYCALGLPAVHSVLGSDPFVYRKLADVEYEHDVSFVGRKFGDRADMVEGIRSSGIRIAACGDGWERGFLPTEEMVRMFNVSRINLCFTKSYVADRAPQMKGRIFDVTMAGGLLLCEYVPGIEDLFDPGKEIVLFRTQEEAVRLIQRYLANESERESIAEAGWRRAHRDHTRQQRLEDALVRLLDLMQTSPSWASGSSMVPAGARRARGQYHLHWAKGLARAGFPKERSREELQLAMLDLPPWSREVRNARLLTRLPQPVIAPTVRALDAARAFRARAKVGMRVRAIRRWALRRSSS